MLVRSCLYNWLGYGNLDAETWFVGMEEGGAEVWRKPEKPLSLEASLAIRATFKPAMDFQKVWRKLYGYDDIGDGFPYLVASRNNVWRYIAAFYLYQRGKISYASSSNQQVEDKITEFLKKNFGSKKGDLFFCEFLPLPRQKREEWPELYQNVWPSANDYYKEVMPKRFSLILKEIMKHKNVKQIVSFDRTFTEYILNGTGSDDDNSSTGSGLALESKPLESWTADDKKKYAIYSVKVAKGRSIMLLDSPFFGYMGYGIDWHEKKGLPYAAYRLARLNHNSNRRKGSSSDGIKSR